MLCLIYCEYFFDYKNAFRIIRSLIRFLKLTWCLITWKKREIWIRYREDDNLYCIVFFHNTALMFGFLMKTDLNFFLENLRNFLVFPVDTIGHRPKF